MPYAFSVTVDDRYFYELAGKPFTVLFWIKQVYFELNEWDFGKSYDQYWSSLKSEELFSVDTKEMLMY